MQNSLTESIAKKRYAAFQWRYNLATTQKIALAFGMAILTGLMAQIRIPLPFTPVPITGQTFAVLLAGVLLGKNWGGISMAIYAVLGAVGLPWFAGFGGGVAVLFGPTGGYIFGFVLAALFIGYMSDRFIKSRNFIPMLLLMLFANFVLIHGTGLIQLSIWLNFVKGSSSTFYEILALGTLPFIAGGLIKVIAAATLAKGITPKKDFR
ncbi:MAG: biotin transporter BioY [candidate division Zixibacteria bacterium]|nr:biotin transporter BioY [candidate division Zixibacteria bacterium]